MLGFGRRVTWTSDLVVPPGHKMTFKDALHILSINMVIKIVVPNWANNLTKQTREVDLAFTELKVCFFFNLFETVLTEPVSCLIHCVAIHAGNGGSSQGCG